jgi:hypothetical protein
MTYLDYNDGRGPIPCDAPSFGEQGLQDIIVDQLVRKHGWRYRMRDVNQVVVERGK